MVNEFSVAYGMPYIVECYDYYNRRIGNGVVVKIILYRIS
jgi:hypothetical protein